MSSADLNLCPVRNLIKLHSGSCLSKKKSSGHSKHTFPAEPHFVQGRRAPITLRKSILEPVAQPA